MPLQRARLKISDLSANRKNKSADKNKKVAAVSLSLTSMVDMFAILVIFLLTNNQSVEEWVKLEHDISLPHAKTADTPKKAVTIQVAADKIYAQDSAPGSKEATIVDLASASKGPLVVEALRSWLTKLGNKEGYVNVVADEKVSYGAVRRVISTAQVSGFKNVNLAVFPR
jgi:biopolymer transport protein ExbD